MVQEYKSSFLLAKRRLISYIGSDMAEEVLDQALKMSGILEIPTSPDELYRIGIMLEEHQDNAISAIGISMKVKSLLLGAKSI